MIGCPHLEDKALSGSQRSQLISGDPLYIQKSPTLRDRRKVGLTLDTCIGRSSSILRKKEPLSPLKESFLTEGIMNSLDQQPLKSTSGKKTLESQTLNSNLELSLSCEAEKRIGMKSGMLQEAETSWLSPLMYEVLNTDECNLIATSDELGLILQNLLPLNVEFTYFGVLPVLENQEGHGMKRVSLLTLRVPLQNSGMVTKVKIINQIKNMLLLTNLEEISASLTCYDGWTDTPFWLRRKDLASYCLLAQSGSPATSRLPAGILLWMRTLPLLCCED